jgi:hypothetical protein
MKKIKIFKKFIDDYCSTDLNEWIINQKTLTAWNYEYYLGGYRFFDPDNKKWDLDEYGRILNPIENINKNFLELRSKIYDVLKFRQEYKSKTATSLVSLIKKYGQVPSHKDSTIEDFIHVRANVILSNPNKGACVIIENKKYKLETGDLILFPANILEHSTTEHKSDIPRTLVSYPFLIKN